MIRKYFLPLLAVIGVVFASWTVVSSSRPVPAAEPVAQPAAAPFQSFVAGTGLIEASTENIVIGTHLAGIVTDVYVMVGSVVKAGDPLFKLDDRALQAELRVRQTALAQAQAQLARQESLPRPEEVPPADARVKEAEASLSDAQHQLALMESVTDKRAISQDDLNRSNSHFDLLAGVRRESNFEPVEHKIEEVGPTSKTDIARERADIIKEGLPTDQRLPHQAIFGI
jgi:HlyD family secretion protein